MNKKFIYLYLYTLFLISIYPTHTNAFDIEKQELTTRISGDEELKGTVLKIIKNKVENIPDLELSHTKKQWVIDIVVSRVGIKEINFSVTVLERLKNNLIVEHTNPQYREMVEKLTSEAYYFEEHWVQTSEIKNLNADVEIIMTRFDSSFLEKRRKSYQQLRKLMNPTKELSV